MKRAAIEELVKDNAKITRVCIHYLRVTNILDFVAKILYTNNC